MVRRAALTKITAADVDAYVEHCQKKGAAAASINRELAILKRAYTLAIRAGKLLHAHRPYMRCWLSTTSGWDSSRRTSSRR